MLKWLWDENTFMHIAEIMLLFYKKTYIVKFLQPGLYQFIGTRKWHKNLYS